MSRDMWVLVMVVVALVGDVCTKPLDTTTKQVELRMPDVQPKVADTYLCYPMKMGEKATYITGFVPHGNMSTAHHILLYGCQEPGKKNEVWNCGEMAAKTLTYGEGPVCKSGAKIVYAWAMDAPELKLPPGVGFMVGDHSDIPYLVLQVHYKDVSRFVPPNNARDNSGLTLQTTEVAQPKRAGVYLLGTDGDLPPHSTVYMETACSVSDPITIHPFAFRTHAHTHGQVVAGYRVRDGEWTEIGRESPQKPQMFYNVSRPDLTITKGDILAARCTMVNDGDVDIKIGETQKDEMCNFYIMYWVKGDHIMSEEYCFTPGPPDWSWADFEGGLHAEKAPHNASIVPATGKFFRATQKIIKQAQQAFDDTDRVMDEQFLDMMAGGNPDYLRNQDTREGENGWYENNMDMEPWKLDRDTFPRDTADDFFPWAEKGNDEQRQYRLY